MTGDLNITVRLNRAGKLLCPASVLSSYVCTRAARALAHLAGKQIEILRGGKWVPISQWGKR